MTIFTVVLYAHLLGAVALFIGQGIEWTASSLFRGASSTEQVRAWLRVFKVSPPLSGIGIAVLLLSGGYLAQLSGAMKQGWIPASLLAIGVALVLGFALILPRMNKIRKTLPSLNEPVSPELRARLTDPILLSAIRIRVLLAVGILYLMAAKMPFTPSLLALLIALAVGLLFSAPVWRRPTI
ncbi:MAG TPA: hypothetical protein VFN20_15240 [Candidatus Acidoferrum sp.]|jgi:Predicted integral membrane protein (DUF2269)|nr:hypothetical protein [Candidatus Acidoferrum sp.]